MLSFAASCAMPTPTCARCGLSVPSPVAARATDNAVSPVLVAVALQGRRALQLSAGLLSPSCLLVTRVVGCNGQLPLPESVENAARRKLLPRIRAPDHRRGTSRL